MPSLQFPSAVKRAAGGLRDAFVASAARERTVVLALVLYAVVWATYGTIAKGYQGLHPDMTELIAWSRQMAWGFNKHGPIGALLVWAWFSVLPVTEWAYYLLAMLMPAGALWLMWRLSADYLSVEKRVAGIALMTFVPFFNFHALKFNVNTVLMPVWAVTAWWFLRSFERRSLGYAALAGLAAAVAMLTKYWSVFLLAGLVLAALSDPRRGAYFRSAAPWVTVAAGFALMAPHLYWLTQHDYAPFSYAVGVHDQAPYIDGALSVFGYLAGSIGYVAVPIIVVLLMARPDRAMLSEMLWPKQPSRRLAAAAFWAPFLLPLVASLGSGVEITSLWSMSAFALLPVLLLAPAPSVRPVETERILVAAAVFPLIMLMVSPAIEVATRPPGPPPVARQAPRLAAAVEQIWHAVTPRPLRFVGGDSDIAYPVVSFAADRPRLLASGLAPPSRAALRRAGEVLLCYQGDRGCLNEASRSAGSDAGGVVRRNVVVSTGRAKGQARGYTVVVVPPGR